MSGAPTGPVLALESSTSLGSVAVGDASGVFAEVARNVAGGHSSALLPAAEQVLRSAGLRPADLAGVVVGGGPGSFTGLRIAAATAKGMLQALRIPLFSYSGLLAAAACAWGAPGPVCALFDARRRDVYAACYRIGNREPGTGNRGEEAHSTGGGEKGTVPCSLEGQGKGGGDSLFPGGKGLGVAVEVLLEPTALSVEAVVERFRAGEPPLFVGEGALLYRDELERELGARVMPAHLGLPRASSLIWLATHAPGLGRVADSTAWEPEYVRASGAERIAARAARDAAGS